MNVNVAVCGIFHFGNYIKYLLDEDIVARFYFSHKIGANASLDLPNARSINIWLKEYLVHGHARLFGERLSVFPNRVYGRLWAEGALLRWQSCDLLHVMAHGHALRMISRARRSGAKVLAEVVNTHPSKQCEVLAREMDFWGLRGARRSLNTREQALVQEVEQSDWLLAPTETVRRSFVERGIPASRIRKIPYAANLSRFFPRGPDDPIPTRDGPLRIVCVGSIGLRKGQLRLIEACRRLGPKAVELTLIGAASKQAVPILRRYTGAFCHIQRVPNDRLRTHLLSHDLFVLPSLEEGLAVSICEAMACGLPIVATRESGAEEIVTDGEEGLFALAGDTDSLVGCLSYVIDNRDWLDSAGAKASESTQRVVNWKRYAGDLVELYRDILMSK